MNREQPPSTAPDPPDPPSNPRPPLVVRPPGAPPSDPTESGAPTGSESPEPAPTEPAPADDSPSIEIRPARAPGGEYRASVFVTRPIQSLGRPRLEYSPWTTRTLNTRWRQDELDELDRLVVEDCYESRRDLIGKALDLYTNLNEHQRAKLRSWNLKLRAGCFDPPKIKRTGRPRGRPKGVKNKTRKGRTRKGKPKSAEQIEMEARMAVKIRRPESHYKRQPLRIMLGDHFVPVDERAEEPGDGGKM